MKLAMYAHFVQGVGLITQIYKKRGIERVIINSLYSSIQNSTSIPSRVFALTLCKHAESESLKLCTFSAVRNSSEVKSYFRNGSLRPIGL
jgi:hypothetical protein